MYTRSFTFVAGLLLVSAVRAQPQEKRAAYPVAEARTVLAAVVQAAETKGQTKGDELTALYYREAARAANRLPSKQRADAFLLALGVALDDSDLLRQNPVTRELWQQIEPEDARRRRLRVLGTPTMRGRHDLAQHFSVSGALNAVGGPKFAESAGIFKEQLDMRPGGSGFSFIDLCADLAGIAFADHVRGRVAALGEIAKEFRVSDHLPEFDGLREGLTREEFARDYGSVSDGRFRQELRALWDRVERLRRGRR
jgi:hypothetical protein